MKVLPVSYFATLVFSLLACVSPAFSKPSTPISAPSANGVYRFDLGDDFSKYVEFSASLDERGVASGQMTFSDQGFIPEQDPDDASGHEEKPRELSFTATLDSLTIERNRAVMGGTITDSSERSFIGRWVQLVVEDNGDDRERPDRLGWRVSRPEEGGWVPADAELRDDQGAWWKWWATDAEREDDAGVQSTSIIPGTRRGCPLFPISSYEFSEMTNGEGQIQVQP